jgi:thiamine-monophosphate kinase
MPDVEEADEFALIARYFRPLSEGMPAALDLQDDAAVLDVPIGRQLVVTTDSMVAGIHFLETDPSETVGAKLLAVNLSDLAAMAAVPLAYVLSVALPANWDGAAIDGWLSGFVAGLKRMQRAFDIHLIGGDTVATAGPSCLTVTAFGTVALGEALRRSGASPGDLVFVSGSIGDASLGLRILNGSLDAPGAVEAASLIELFRNPQPRVALGRRLAGVASAAADVSDGLVADLSHICRASGVTARIESTRIPLSAAASSALGRHPDFTTVLLTGGDDYELVFTVPPSQAEAVISAGRETGTPVTEIGHIRTVDAAPDGLSRVTVIDPYGQTIRTGAGGYRHFAQKNAGWG